MYNSICRYFENGKLIKFEFSLNDRMNSKLFSSMKSYLRTYRTPRGWRHTPVIRTENVKIGREIDRDNY